MYTVNVRVVDADGKNWMLHYCLECTDYVIDTEEGEDLVLKRSGEVVRLD
jgi:hypothetical protein